MGARLDRVPSLKGLNVAERASPNQIHGKAPMKLKDAIAEIMRCRIVDPTRAAMLEAQVLRRGSSLNIDAPKNPEAEAPRQMVGLFSE